MRCRAPGTYRLAARPTRHRAIRRAGLRKHFPCCTDLRRDRHLAGGNRHRCRRGVARHHHGRHRAPCRAGVTQGAIIGGLLLGFAEAIGYDLLPGSVTYLLIFIAMIVFLIFKPNGLFGKPWG